MKLLEKVKNTKNKKKVAAAIIAMAIVLTAGTIALLSQVSQAANNNFNGAGVNVGVVENGTDKTLEDSTKGGNTNTYDKIGTSDEVTKVEKSVFIKNITSDTYPTTDTYVRVRLVAKLVYDDTSADGSAAEYADQTVAKDITGNVTFNFADNAATNWTAYTSNGEKYYYYKNAIAPGNISDQLLSSVSYNGKIDAGQQLEVEVLTEGIAANQHMNADGTAKAYSDAWTEVLNTGNSSSDAQILGNASGLTNS